MAEDDNVTQVMPDNPELIALAAEAKDFANSPFGQYMLNKAAIEAGEAARQLCTVNPDDKSEIIKLQYQAGRLTDLNKWINEAITMGAAEYANYQQKLSGEE